jgi:hypothetical protein
VTELDKYEPHGQPIHPYDVYELLTAAKSCKHMASSPRCADEEDYIRNQHKIGDVLDVDGTIYFQTTRVPYKSKLFEEHK